MSSVPLGSPSFSCHSSHTCGPSARSATWSSWTRARCHSSQAIGLPVPPGRWCSVSSSRSSATPSYSSVIRPNASVSTPRESTGSRRRRCGAHLRRARLLVLHPVDLGEDARALVVAQRDLRLRETLVELLRDRVVLGAVLVGAHLVDHALGCLDRCLLLLVRHAFQRSEAVRQTNPPRWLRCEHTAQPFENRQNVCSISSAGSASPTWVSSTATVPSGWTYADVPVPPTQPYRPITFHGSISSVSTPPPNPQPWPSRKKPPISRCFAVIWSVVISRTESSCMIRQSSPMPPLTSIRPNASQSSTVVTSPPDPDAKAGSLVNTPSTSSLTWSTPWSSRDHSVVNRSSFSAGTWKPVSTIPSGSRSRSAIRSAKDSPVARESSTART